MSWLFPLSPKKITIYVSITTLILGFREVLFVLFDLFLNVLVNY